ncbi:MAG: type II toxin-antitoxin system VapC family toxin [Pyrinomonadaceae bacterium MAG19_C2-C3]|nr:type II toxin-antitoxin system VapC family toxin [Pyrinomonadaceae bacterium MAG19_C2-C3]
MTIVVADASVAVKWYAPEVHTLEAEKLLNNTYEIHAPELMLPEFGNIIWKKRRKGDLTAHEATRIIKAFGNQSIRFHSHTSLLQSAFAGASLSNQTVYDWTYMALAVSLSCQFVTADNRFYKALENTKLKKHLLWVADI